MYCGDRVPEARDPGRVTAPPPVRTKSQTRLDTRLVKNIHYTYICIFIRKYPVNIVFEMINRVVRAARESPPARARRQLDESAFETRRVILHPTHTRFIVIQIYCARSDVSRVSDVEESQLSRN